MNYEMRKVGPENMPNQAEIFQLHQAVEAMNTKYPNAKINEASVTGSQSDGYMLNGRSLEEAAQIMHSAYGPSSDNGEIYKH
jgi:hypothetical protein